MPEITEVTVSGEEVESGGAPLATALATAIYDAVCGIDEGDYTGTTAIKDAIYAGETSIGVLPGTYDCSTMGAVGGEKGSSTNQLTSISITGLGAMPGDVVFNRSAVPISVLYLGSNLRFNNLTIEDTMLQWNAASQSDVTFDTVNFTRDSMDGIFIDTGGDPFTDLKMHNCKAYGTASAASDFFIYTKSLIITECQFLDMAGDVTVYGANGGRGLIDNCYWENSRGLSLESDYDELEANFVFSNNSWVEGAGDIAWWGPNLKQNVSNVDLINNRIVGVYGMGIDGTHRNIRIINNYIDSGDYHGIELGTNLHDCVIKGNTIIAGIPTSGKSGIYSANSTPMTNVIIKDNEISGYQDSGIEIADISDSIISDNTFNDCKKAISNSELRSSIINNNIIMEQGTSGPGYDFNYVNKSKITNNIIKNASLVFAEGIGTGELIDSQICGNDIDNCSDPIRITGAITSSKIDGNTITNVEYKAINITTSAPINNSTINNNVLRNDTELAGSTGIIISNTTPASNLNYDVSHNNIHNFVTDITDTPGNAQTLGNL